LLKKLRPFLTGHYNLLLLNLTLLFIFRPADRGFIYLGVWKILLTGVFFAAIFNVHHPRVVKNITWFLMVPALVLTWLNLFHHMEILFVADASLTAIFILICTGSIVSDVLIRTKVNLETLRGVICAYFMVGFAFAYIYYLIEYVNPGSFHLIERVSTFAYNQYLSEMLYFSFITLLTIGFGDITPLKDVAQTATIIEGIIGQFYIAILVARLVSVYAFYQDKRLFKKLTK
jgi:voltage-gated potassium channel